MTLSWHLDIQPGLHEIHVFWRNLVNDFRQRIVNCFVYSNWKHGNSRFYRVQTTLPAQGYLIYRICTSTDVNRSLIPFPVHSTRITPRHTKYLLECFEMKICCIQATSLSIHPCQTLFPTCSIESINSG